MFVFFCSQFLSWLSCQLLSGFEQYRTRQYMMIQFTERLIIYSKAIHNVWLHSGCIMNIVHIASLHIPFLSEYNNGFEKQISFKLGLLRITFFWHYLKLECSIWMQNKFEERFSFKSPASWYINNVDWGQHLKFQDIVRILSAVNSWVSFHFSCYQALNNIGEDSTWWFNSLRCW